MKSKVEWVRWGLRHGVLITIFTTTLLSQAKRLGIEPPPPPSPPQPVKVVEMVIPLPKAPPKRTWHPRHRVKTWLSQYQGRIFRTVQIPRCNHVEMVLTYVSAPGETCTRAKRRTGAIAVTAGSYHNPHSMALADFFQKNGRVFSARRTRRGILASRPSEVADILDEITRGKNESSLALGARLVPFKLDGFTRAFANRQTDRMAIGLTKGYIFIVQGNSDLWRLGRFMRDGLGCSKAINSDGGHVVKGRAPVHIAFRWRKKRPAVKAAQRTPHATRK